MLQIFQLKEEKFSLVFSIASSYGRYLSVPKILRTKPNQWFCGPFPIENEKIIPDLHSRSDDERKKETKAKIQVQIAS